MDAQGFNISREAADKLLGLRDGNAALLYLYILSRGPLTDRSLAAAELCRTEREIIEAESRLNALGLFGEPALAAKKPRPADELPEYSAGEIIERAAKGGEFSAVVDEAQRALGKKLSGSDLNILFGVYDHLGLPADVICLLLHHCVEEFRRKNGEGRLPRMKWVENEAYEWFNLEIMTVERAEEYLRRRNERRSELGEVARELQIRGRELTATESRYISSWLDMGYTAEVLAVAYDKTVVKTGMLTWRYMDSIVKSWHSKGLRTLDDVKNGDVPRAPSQAGAGDMEHMKKLLERVRKDVP